MSRSRKQNIVPTAPSAPMTSWLLSVLTLSSHRTPPKSECPAASHTRETGSEQAAGMELHHPGYQAPQGSSPLSSLCCTGLCAAHTVSQQQVCSLDPYQIYPGVTRPSTSQCYVVCCLSLGQARPISGACSGFLIAPQARAHFPEHHGLPEGGV